MTGSSARVPSFARRSVLLAAVVLGVSVSTSCGGSSSADSDVTVLEIELGRYTISPAVLVAPAGELELLVTNVDVGLPHNLVVFGKGTRMLAPGESQTLKIGEIGEGEYQMWCDVQGHREAGQTGALRVEAPAAVAPTGSTG